MYFVKIAIVLGEKNGVSACFLKICYSEIKTKRFSELSSDLTQGKEEFPYIKCTSLELAVSGRSETMIYLFNMTFRAASFGSCYLTTTQFHTLVDTSLNIYCC